MQHGVTDPGAYVLPAAGTQSWPWSLGNVAMVLGGESETGWDLGPFAAVLAPGQMCPGNKIRRNYKGLKLAAAHAILEQIMDKKIQKDQKPNCHF